MLVTSLFMFCVVEERVGREPRVKDLSPDLCAGVEGVGRLGGVTMFSLFKERGRRFRPAGRGRVEGLGVEATSTTGTLIMFSAGDVSTGLEVIIESSPSSSSSSSTRV